MTSFIAADIAYLFFNFVVCKFGMPKKIINDCALRFVHELWTTFMSKLGTKLGLYYLYHLQTDGLSERFYRSVE